MSDTLLQEETQELSIIERSLEQFKEAGTILVNNQNRAAQAEAVGKKIIADWEANGKVSTPELDARMQRYLANCSKAKGEMNEDRKPITQTLTLVAKAFTSEEARIDVANKETVAFQVQQIRNAYAKQVYEAEQEQLRQIELQKKKDEEAINLKAEGKRRLVAFFNNYLTEKKLALNSSFNSLTLETFDENSNKLREYVPAYAYQHFQSFAPGHMYAICHTPEEISAMLRTVIEPSFNELAEQYKTEMSELKLFLIDRLPSKKQELEAIKQQEEGIEKQRLEEIRLKVEQEQANEEQRKILEQQRLELEQKQKETELQRQRQLNEQKQREADQQKQIELDNQERQQQQAQVIEQQREVDQTMGLFNNVVAIATTTTVSSKPETRQGYEIEALGPAAYLAMFQQWFNLEGVTMTVEELDKKLDFVKKFCEKTAHKDESKKIQSGLIKYNPSFKAVNRKTTTK